MQKTCTMVIVAALLGSPPLAMAADKCPAELSQAKSMLGKATAASSKAGATPSRQLAGARAQDIQAPRTGSQDVQAPRTGSQDIQAPRTGAQDIQAPRAQAAKGKDTPPDIQEPRGADNKARLDKARKLISDAEAACKKGDMALSSSKATEAMAALK